MCGCLKVNSYQSHISARLYTDPTYPIPVNDRQIWTICGITFLREKPFVSDLYMASWLYVALWPMHLTFGRQKLHGSKLYIICDKLSANVHQHTKFHMSQFFSIFKMAAVHLSDLFGGLFGPLINRVSFCFYAKFGCDRCSSFDNMKVSIFGLFSPYKLGFGENLTTLIGSTKPQDSIMEFGATI